MALKSDLELVHDFKRGDVGGFNELVRRYQQRVYWIARRVLESHAEADDVTQDVFVRVYESLKKFRSDSSFYTWLYRIATNVSLNALRKRKARLFVSLEDAGISIESEIDGPHEQLDRSQYLAALEKAIAKLPAKQKLVFVMRYYEEMPYEEISRILKRSEGGLKANYFHALKKIQKYVRKEMDNET